MEFVQRYKTQIAIGVAVVVSIGLVALVFSANRPTCSPSGSLAPRADAYLMDTKNVASLEKSALVNQSNYLILLDNPNGFLELELSEFSRDKGKEGSDSETVTMKYDCAKLDIKLKKSGTTDVTYQMTEFSLETRKPGGEANKFEYLCKADATSYQLTFKPASEYFSCRGTIALNCVNKEKDSRGNDYQKTVAEIVFNVLELELDGKSIAEGKFSKTAKASSCPIQIK